MNGDAKPDLIAANAGGGNVSVLLGDGAGAFGAKTDFAAGAGPFQTVARGPERRREGRSRGRRRQRQQRRGAGRRRRRRLRHPDAASGRASSPYALVAGDVNGDGRVDIAAANADSSNVSVLLGDGAGGFAARTNFASASRPFALALADLNGDGALDLATADYNTSPGGGSVLLGDGAGGFALTAGSPFAAVGRLVRSRSATSTPTASPTSRSSAATCSRCSWCGARRSRRAGRPRWSRPPATLRRSVSLGLRRRRLNGERRAGHRDTERAARRPAPRARSSSVGSPTARPTPSR